MVKNGLSIIIQRPIEEVFIYVSNLSNGPEWQSGLFEVRRITPEPTGIGSQYASVRKFLGRKLEAVVEVVGFEPNRKFVIKSPAGSTPFEETFLFEPAAEGTRLTTELELHSVGIMGLAEPLIARSLKREMDADFGDLKDLLEHQVTPVSA